MGSFESKCLSLATIYPLETNPDEMIVPDKYKTSVNSLITIMKPKMDRLDKVSIKFIENCFKDINEAVRYLDRNTNCGEIPDSVINVLSTELYGKSTKCLTEKEQAIIKVLSCYICIQN